MELVLTIHSLWRWIVVLIALVALVKLALGWSRGQPPTPLDRRLVLLFTISLDIQVVLGLVLFILQAANGVLPAAGVEHTITMVIASIFAHATLLWRARTDNTALRNNFLAVLISLFVIVAGVAVVGGWSLSQA